MPGSLRDEGLLTIRLWCVEPQLSGHPRVPMRSRKRHRIPPVGRLRETTRICARDVRVRRPLRASGSVHRGQTLSRSIIHALAMRKGRD